MAAAAHAAARTTQVTWQDVTAPVRARLESSGISSASFPSFLQRLHDTHLRRVREGDLDHLVFYLLQSRHFTQQPPIEPALSAKAFTESLPPDTRESFLRRGDADPSGVPTAVRARIAAFIHTLDSSDRDPRVAFFRTLVNAAFPIRRQRETALQREYVRVMRFVYEKEFVAQHAPHPADAVAELYRERGLSTDTAVEAGYVVYLGLAVMKSLEPDRRVRRVLIVGPGLDLAPRTGFLEGAPLESYQPWAVIDALLSLGLARAGDLQVVAADINPRVVDHLRRAQGHPPSLRLISGIQETSGVTLSDEYREYFARLGGAISQSEATPDRQTGHLGKSLQVEASIARALRAEPLDIVTDRLDGPPFDLAIATNVLPYFDDVELALAMNNVASMLAPSGVFLHNEARPTMGETAAAVGLVFEQSRQAIIARVQGAAPLVDTIWLHRKNRNPVAWTR